MPRVTTHTKSPRATKQEYVCTAYPCKVAEERDGDRTIRPGDSYYQWQKRFGGPQRRHTACGFPRPTQLSNRKTAQIAEAIEDAEIGDHLIDAEIPENWDGDTGSIEVSYEGLQSALADIASTATDVGDEYEQSADNMPESLQYGEQAEMMREVGNELRDWASDLESFQPNSDEPDWPERDEDESDEDWADNVQAALDNWRAEVISEAEDKLGEMPEYQG